MTSRVAAQLQRYEAPTGGGSQPGGQLGGPIKFMFNPNRLSLSKSAGWTPHVVRGAAEAGVAEFTGANPRTLSLEIFLDTTDRHSTEVQQRVEALLSCCVPTKASIAAKAPSPPWVLFSWGQFSTVSFYGYVASVNASYTLFDTSGIPLRATASLTVTEVGGAMPGQNPTSGGRTGRRIHRLAHGDTLEMLAYREYGDATAWRLIAEANEIDDTVRLCPGSELLLPALDDEPVPS